MTNTCDGGRPFGDVLRERRLAAGLTQEELAGRSGSSPRAIGGLERGRVWRPLLRCAGQCRVS